MQKSQSSFAKATVGKDLKINKIRHSLAHLLATAVLKKYPDVKLGIGPVIENGFYYDFDFNADKRGPDADLRGKNANKSGNKNQKISEEELPEIEEKMRARIKENLIFKKENITSVKAKNLFKNQPYKLELIKELQKSKEPINVYYTYPQPTSKSYKLTAKSLFVDLCKGPHIKSTKEINPDAFKITKIAGAYWRGDEKNPMLTRLYGIAFETKEELNNYLKQQEEAEKRDHKKLGPQLGLFIFHETAPGMPYWLPKGLIIINELVKFWREEHKKRDYYEIKTPLINKKELYEISGHWEHYRENMFIAETEEKETYCLKPMNCPNAMIVFGMKPRSYKELPLRLGDTDTLHRFERSGTLNGLFRVREFSQDDAHIFITENQIKDEYEKILEITEQFYSIFGIEYFFRLGTRPKDFMGDIKNWNRAEKELKGILEASGKQYFIEKGDGAFYGPKLDILMKDALGRDWQTGTIQLDFQIPKRFKLSYIDKDGKEKTPAVIHRVIYGSLERFVGILIEHFAGAFPLWLSPIQVEILPIGENHRGYGNKILEQLNNADIRAEIDETNETLGKRIREAEMQKIPYIIIVGDKEVQSNNIAIRKRNKGDIGAESLNVFIQKLQNELQNKI